MHGLFPALQTLHRLWHLTLWGCTRRISRGRVPFALNWALSLSCQSPRTGLQDLCKMKFVLCESLQARCCLTLGLMLVFSVSTDTG